MGKHTTGLAFRSMWHEQDERAERVTVSQRPVPAHSTGETPYVPFYAMQGAGNVRILPDPASGVGTPMGGVPAGMPI